ncbi:TPA: hypothetical protein NDT34_003753 [Citrobacter freundii]|uniref:Uncharacterized protein n=1 Tax=Citrobacter freundii TaxID=546 RepID=A0AAP9TVL5_CITFR|nr:MULTISPECIES: hypothetical protein [Citrobacter freundii complex]EKV4145417.1 hypothetical protein [Citrobacter freundii]ELO3996869.1 hypothetical protein [Citrobacter freundii]ELT0524913.1 hypothetical protein [Citrobacter freundii]MBJ9306590.1 hypothetical protein [Citrobacter freundii]NTY49474.1 hypothetical protein [Citrobacter freundii]
MSAPEQHSTERLSSHDHEQESKTVAEKGQKVPESWNLSPEQRAFIDLLTDDEQKQ